MSKVSDYNPNQPDKSAIYKDEMARTTQLFKNAMQEYEKTEETHKKEQLQKVMQECMTIINQILNNTFKESAKPLEDQLSKDYNNYIASSTKDASGALTQDIDDIEDKLA